MFSKPDPGMLHPQEILGVDGAQVSELKKVLRLAVDVGSSVQEEGRPAGRGKDGSDGRPVDPRDKVGGKEGRRP